MRKVLFHFLDYLCWDCLYWFAIDVSSQYKASLTQGIKIGKGGAESGEKGRDRSRATITADTRRFASFLDLSF